MKVSDSLFKWMVEIRRTIHRTPELGFTEHKTSALICRKLQELGLDYTAGVAGTGVLGRITTRSGSKTIAVRADMDALPVSEETGLEFASCVPGVMHACGHDGHVAIALGAAALLKENPPPGNVLFVFQPDEEGTGGAKPMVEAGVLNGVSAIFGGHLDLHYKTGEIAIKPGVNTAFTNGFDVEITGRGGHAARPHEAIDSVLIACQMVLQIQTIVSRMIDPLSPAVITIGKIQAGTVNNAIAENALIKGTIRTIDTITRETIFNKLHALAGSLAGFYNAEIKVTIHSGYPSVVNDPGMYEIAKEAAILAAGREKVIEFPNPVMGGEDFAFFAQIVPACFVRYGALGNTNEHAGSAHSSRFDFDETAMITAAGFMANAVTMALKKL
ncbi:MAG: amidohydrolase [Nitrospirae bacterium]|nr:amidohydrolase [Nitrospirota bacterium]MBF0535480.1 amidohydrolase [Nitrospirota bacterium]MBF0617388.1 amidohydrolase [Nitrospirota bacterium]